MIKAEVSNCCFYLKIPHVFEYSSLPGRTVIYYIDVSMVYIGIRTYLVRERLREGTKLREYEMLQSALMTFSDLVLEEKDQDLTKARKTMDILQEKRGMISIVRVYTCESMGSLILYDIHVCIRFGERI